MNKLHVKKSTGELVLFSTEKLEKSLFRSGASPDLITHIIKKITDDYIEGITTSNIYKKAFHMLRNASYSLAAKYKMKRAILELGPSGYPFEEYIGHLMRYQGFKVGVGVIMSGKCVNHEVDVYARNEEKEIIIECKHHRSYSYKSDIKVVLYVHARTNDIISELRRKNDQVNYNCWIVTNTRYSKDAIDYANCHGLHLISWDHPNNGSLPERIALSGMYPITCLCSMSKKEKQLLIDNEIVLCRQLLENPELLSPINRRKHHEIIKECEEIINV